MLFNVPFDLLFGHRIMLRVALAVHAVFLAIVFVWPLFSMHKYMKKWKELELRRIDSRFKNYYII